MKTCDMTANFDLPRTSIRDAALRAGLKLVIHYPQSEGQLHIMGHNDSSEHGDTGQCTTATVAFTFSTMRLIAALAAEQKGCLISCKSLG